MGNPHFALRTQTSFLPPVTVGTAASAWASQIDLLLAQAIGAFMATVTAALGLDDAPIRTNCLELPPCRRRSNELLQPYYTMLGVPLTSHMPPFPSMRPHAVAPPQLRHRPAFLPQNFGTWGNPSKIRSCGKALRWWTSPCAGLS